MTFDKKTYQKNNRSKDLIAEQLSRNSLLSNIPNENKQTGK